MRNNSSIRLLNGFKFILILVSLLMLVSSVDSAWLSDHFSFNMDFIECMDIEEEDKDEKNKKEKFKEQNTIDVKEYSSSQSKENNALMLVLFRPEYFPEVILPPPEIS